PPPRPHRAPVPGGALRARWRGMVVDHPGAVWAPIRALFPLGEAGQHRAAAAGANGRRPQRQATLPADRGSADGRAGVSGTASRGEGAVSPRARLVVRDSGAIMGRQPRTPPGPTEGPLRHSVVYEVEEVGGL